MDEVVRGFSGIGHDGSFYCEPPVNYPEIARRAVLKHIHQWLNKDADAGVYDPPEVYVLWCGIIKGDWTVLCSTDGPDKEFYEVVIDLEKDVANVSSYHKVYQSPIEIEKGETNGCF